MSGNEIISNFKIVFNLYLFVKTTVYININKLLLISYDLIITQIMVC